MSDFSLSIRAEHNKKHKLATKGGKKSKFTEVSDVSENIITEWQIGVQCVGLHGAACGWEERCPVILHIEIQYHKILAIVCRLEHWTLNSVPHTYHAWSLKRFFFSICIYDKCEGNVDCDRSHKCSFKAIIKLIIDVVVCRKLRQQYDHVCDRNKRKTSRESAESDRQKGIEEREGGEVGTWKI